MYSYRIVAELKDEERNFNLRLYERQRISIKMGPVVFGFMQDELTSPTMKIITQNLSLGGQDLVGRSTSLAPGHQLLIGRRPGLDIINSAGLPDYLPLRRLGGRALLRAMRQTDELSRDHTQIDVVDAMTLKIKDLGSTTGTLVYANPHSPETLRSQMRIIE